MKKIAAAVICLTAFSAQPSFAHTSSFEGFFTGLGVGVAGNTSFNSYNARIGETAQYAEMGHVNALSFVDAGYSTMIYQNWNIGAGAAYDFGHKRAGGTFAIDSAGNTYDNHTQLKNHYSLYLQPSYAFNNTSMAFLKFGYHTTTLINSELGQYLQTNYSYTTKLKGLGYGLGLKTLITHHLYLQTEAQFIRYSDKIHVTSDSRYKSITNRVMSATGLISIGYQF